jgi:transposase
MVIHPWAGKLIHPWAGILIHPWAGKLIHPAVLSTTCGPAWRRRQPPSGPALTVVSRRDAMAGRRCDVLDVREMLKRLRQGQSARRVARELATSRNTVREYERWFKAEGLLAADAALPDAAELAERLAARSAEVVGPPPKLLPHRDEITALIDAPLQMTVAWDRFRKAHRDLVVSYSAFRRFVRRYIESRSGRGAVLRIEVAPGVEAQVDFGFAGWIPREVGAAPRKAWVFVMTLSHSRHQYVELVQDQSVPTWLRLHRRAFEFFGGVPERVVLDNLKAGIVKASVTDPEAQRSYRECAEYYGFLISPCAPRTPQHKGKVERGIQYVRRSLLAGRSFGSLAEANEAALDWVLGTAGVRVHGTTHEVPLDVFAARERPALRLLPDEPFDLCEYKQVTLHPDCHVVYQGSFYSADYKLIGQKLWLRAGTRVVHIVREHRLIRTHVRSYRRGQRVTNPADLPPEKQRYSMQTPSWCRQRACELGVHVGEFVEQLLSDRVLDRLRGAQALLRMAERYPAARLDAACRRALACDALTYRAVKTILARSLDAEPLPGETVAPPPPPPTPTYARTFFDLFDETATH